VGDPKKLISAVLVTCLVAAVGLAVTYGLTKDRIEEQERLREQESLIAAFPAADSFEKIEDEALLAEGDEISDGVLVSVYEAFDGSGEGLGWSLRLKPRGYGGPIQMVVGLERNGKVTGVSIITMNETPGLGTKVGEDSFLAQFVGWDGSDIDVEAKTLDAVSGATKSSNGIRKGLLAAGHLYQGLFADIQGGE